MLDDADAWRAAADREDYRQKAAAQLGTVGSGNHYVDLMEDEAGFVWMWRSLRLPWFRAQQRYEIPPQGRRKDGMHVHVLP